VVVNYNAGEHLEHCVRSLLADASAGGAPDVVVVDNDSRDGSVAAVTAAHPDVTVVPVGTNLGYATAANRGIAVTHAPVVAVCNADVTVGDGAGAAMVARFEREPDVGAIGPRVRNPDGSVYPSARAFPTPVDAVGHALFGWWWPQNRWTRRYRQLDCDPDRPRDADWVSGAAIWLRRVALDDVDGWDEGYFMYLEDADLGWRLRRRGWRICYEPAATVVHVQALSTSRHPYRMIFEHHRSTARFAAKRWTGARRCLLVLLVPALAVRAALVAAGYALGRRSGNERVAG
jgi:N-acetylglucosaminyl-diphospho-decaprenol L-rhamnosyltransferase